MFDRYQRLALAGRYGWLGAMAQAEEMLVAKRGELVTLRQGAAESGAAAHQQQCQQQGEQIMKHLMSGAAVLALVAGTAFAQDAEKVVNVYNWSDYIDEEILTEFEAETGIKVVYDVFDSNDILETKLLAGASGYDVVVPSGGFLQRQIQAGVFQKLDRSKLSNLGNMWDKIAERTARYDPGNEYSVNYMWGTTGIGYNVDAAKERLGTETIDSWAVIFDPAIVSKFTDCGVHVLDAADEVIPAALNYLGLDPNSKDVDDIEKAGTLIESIRPHVTSFNSSATSGFVFARSIRVRMRARSPCSNSPRARSLSALAASKVKEAA